MKPTIIAKKAGNWVDRGEPATPRVMRVLRHTFDRDPERDAAWLEEHARLIEAMVAADATEVHVMRYLRALAGELGIAPEDLPHTRLAATAVWGLSKAAQVRDFAERVLQGDVPANEPTADTLSHWLAERLLDPAELEEWERSARHPRDDE